MKINNMEKFQLHQMEHLFRRPTQTVQAAKVITITAEVLLQHQEMLVQDQQMLAMLQRIGVEISPLPRRPNLLLKMEILMPIEQSAIMLWVSIIFSDFRIYNNNKNGYSLPF
jgi:hypothetical protein